MAAGEADARLRYPAWIMRRLPAGLQATGTRDLGTLAHSAHPAGRPKRMTNKHLYKVVFMNQGQVFEIYARRVHHGELFGFVAVEELVFGERTSVVVDPSEERIKSLFENVRRSYLPLHSVIRIDEVDKQGPSKISKFEGSNVAQFPIPIYTPGDGKS